MKKLLIVLLCVFSGSTFVLVQSVKHYKFKSEHKFDVQIPIQKDVFEKKLTSSPPSWCLEQIHSDLNIYEKTGITKEMLDQLFHGKLINELSLARFTIVNGYLSFAIGERLLESRQFRHILAAIKKMHEISPIPDIDFIISLEDCINEEKGAPLFVFAKTKEAKSLVLIPDFKALTGYSTLRKTMEAGSQKFPWEKKKERAFWRGSTTGGWLTTNTWEQIARCKLALISLSHPKEIDAKITNIAQCDPEIPSLIKSKGLLARPTSQLNHLEYKYLVDIDGNSCSFERYFWALLSNSLVLKQVTPNIQWYYSALKPYVHFVPLKEDLSDLLEKYQWALCHDQEAKQIAQNATEFAKENLTTEDVFLYMHYLLKEYARLQVPSKARIRVTTPVHRSSFPR